MTYEKAANSYISYIKSIQSEGPYDLLGWSYGAMLSFEIARQLDASGDVVRNIILIDGLFEYKKFIQATKQELFEGEDFYYKYSPLVNFNNKNIKITLFKSMEIDSLQQVHKDLNALALKKHIRSKYYVEKTKANHLDELLQGYKLNIIAMNSGHESWVHNKVEVEKICKEILGLFDNIKKDI
jgi:thioesterase domain-containing protein